MIPFEWFTGGLLLAFAAGWLVRRGVDADNRRRCQACDRYLTKCRACGAI